MKRKFLFVILSAFLFGEIMFVKPLFCAEKYKIVDGDSLEKGKERIRLEGVDAPELFQKCYDETSKEYDCGFEATEALREFMKNVKYCQASGKDVYERTLAECFDENRESINEKMVKSGYALSYGVGFVKEEMYAKTNKKGIWRGKFMRPELYRALNKSKKTRNKIKKR